MKKKQPILNNNLCSESNTNYPIQDNKSIFIEGYLDNREKQNIIMSYLDEINRDDIITLKDDKKAKLQPLKVYINSFGGSTVMGYNIYTRLKHMLAPVITIGTGEVSSSASIIFLGGDIRVIYPFSSMLIHNSSVENVTGDEYYIQTIRNEILNINKTFLKLYNKYSLSKFDEKYWKKVLKEEKRFIGNIIFKLGLANVFVNDEKIIARKADQKIKILEELFLCKLL